MSLATSLQQVASKLMARFGTSATLRQVTPGVYNPETGTVSRTTTDHTVLGIFEAVRQNQISDLVKATDRKFTFAAADISVIPTTADRLIYGSTELEITEVTRIEHEALNIVYELITRQ